MVAENLVSTKSRHRDSLNSLRVGAEIGLLCEMPCIMSHASIPAEERTLPEDLIRLSVGIEDVRDLIDDLTQVS